MVYIFKQLVWNRLFAKLLLFLVCSDIMYAQAVPVQSGRFRCGPDMLNLTCERIGFDACISDNGEYYCMPCNQEYLVTTCGTQDELPGCNLFCTEKAVEKEKEILSSNFTKEMDDITKQATLYKEQNNFLKTVIILLAAFGFVSLITIIIFIWYNIKHCCNIKDDVENKKSETETSKMKLLTKEDGFDNVTEQQDDLGRNDLPGNMTNKDIESDISGTVEQMSTKLELFELEQQNCKSQEEECPAMTKFSNMPPTNTDGNNKLAINENDHSKLERTIA